MNGYERFSPRARTKKNIGSGDNITNSIATQQSLICDWLARHNMPPLSEDQHLVDEFTSARLVPLEERPAGKELLRRIDAGDREVIATALDRLFRNTVDGLLMLEKWRKQKVTVILTNGVLLDLGTASGTLTATMLLGVAQFECQLTAERTSQSHISRQAAGHRISRHIPYGYKEDPEDGKRIVVCKIEQDRICLMKDMRENGRSFRDIRDYLTEFGYTCRGNDWHHGTIRNILGRDNGL